MPVLQRITPCLWFDNQAEEAARFYVSIFENSAHALREGGLRDSRKAGGLRADRQLPSRG